MARINPKQGGSKASSLSRRSFLSVHGTAALTAGIIGLPSLRALKSAVNPNLDNSCEIGPVTGHQRVNEAFRLRHDAAWYERSLALPDHPCNGDEALYPNKIASYSKGLPHNDLGEIDLNAYSALIRALTTGNPADFENIPLGGVRRLVNPQAAFTFELAGPDSHHLAMVPPPAFNSAEEAGEIAELYWQALTLDVPFSDYATNPLTNAAAADLSRLSDFRGPKESGYVTPHTLFRGNTPGDLAGPYISQFLWRNVPYGTATIVQRYPTALPGIDYMIRYADWLAIQRGASAGPPSIDPTPRYIRSGRDLAEYLRLDFTYQAFLSACLILLGVTGSADTANPYATSRTQTGFVSLGGSEVLDLVARSANCAMKCVWYQKWLVHRRLRPEAFGGRVHNYLAHGADYPIHSDILNSTALREIGSKYGTYLLPQAYPDGSPTHPAYGGGHAVISGACTTVLKAFFNESLVFPNPVVASADGLSLVPYNGPNLTVGGELNKLAANISIGRDTAGIHWRSDAIEALKLGEEVAIRILKEMKSIYNEQFGGFSLTKFDGTTITFE